MTDKQFDYRGFFLKEGWSQVVNSNHLPVKEKYMLDIVNRKSELQAMPLPSHVYFECVVSMFVNHSDVVTRAQYPYRSLGSSDKLVKAFCENQKETINQRFFDCSQLFLFKHVPAIGQHSTKDSFTKYLFSRMNSVHTVYSTQFEFSPRRLNDLMIRSANLSSFLDPVQPALTFFERVDWLLKENYRSFCWSLSVRPS
jgi:hypothetical protein